MPPNDGEDRSAVASFRATPATIRRGYRALLEAARAGKISEKRIQTSLKRIAATKALVKPPPPLDMDSFPHRPSPVPYSNHQPHPPGADATAAVKS